MNNKINKKWSYLYGFKLLFIVLLTLGIFFRLVNLDQKVYWQDESATSLRIAGHTKEEFTKQVFNGQVISVEELRQKYLEITSEKTWFDTLNALTQRPEHSPLYYLMARLWAQWFGTSVAVMRSLPALISLLVFPSIYWLCLELFESSLVGWIAIALIAVSPVHVLYAQEARQYSLWILTMVLSSAALLRATRLKTSSSWAIYAATLTLGIYSHIFFALIALGHGIYIFMLERFRLSKNAIAYLIASVAAIVTFIPWLWVMFTYFVSARNRDRVIVPVQAQIGTKYLLDEWFRNINRIFHDADLGSANILIVVLSLFSIYFVCRYAPKRIWLFILTLVGVTALTLGLPDLILGGRRSVRTRYLIPCYLGIELAVAYLLSTQITNSIKWQQKFWQFMMFLIILAGIISSIISSQAVSAWSKNRSITKYYPQIADVINQAKAPLVVSDGSPTSVVSLSYLLNPQVKLKLILSPNIPRVSSDFKQVFLFDASDNLLEKIQIETNSKIEVVAGKNDSKLWKLTAP